MNDEAVQLEGNTVICKRNRVDYDLAVVATGATQNYFNLKGVEHAFSINTLEETKRARRFIEDKYPERIMIMGSGLIGVEAACILAENLDSSVYIIEAKDRILPQFSVHTSELLKKHWPRKE
jgi:NADH dehydrogenase